VFARRGFGPQAQSVEVRLAPIYAASTLEEYSSIEDDSKSAWSMVEVCKGWLNPAAFANPAPFTYGNSSRTLPQVLGPGLINFDSLLAKTSASLSDGAASFAGKCST